MPKTPGWKGVAGGGRSVMCQVCRDSEAGRAMV